MSDVLIEDELDEKQVQECIAAAEKYVSNCKKFEVAVDPSVVIALSTGWNVLKPTKARGEGSLLPLMGILEENKHITKVNLEDVSMRDDR
jgi:lipid II:glycine glycyltransferase (peptidoglycan interpeptide bridge formation enzyme)